MKKKIIVSLLGLAMLFVAMPTYGATVEELQQQLADLMTQITALNAQIAAMGGTPAAGTCTFTRDLSFGVSGDDVKCLQQYLIGGGYSIPAGATGYFGSQTQGAVAAWQTANGVSPTAGYFGPISRAKYTALVGTVTPPDGGVTPPGEAEEGILTAVINPTPASGVKVYEGNLEKSVMGILLKAKLSDITVQRITFNFGTDRIYDYMAYLALYDGETVVKGIDLNSSTVYKSGGNYYLQVSGLDVEVPKDGSKVLTVKLDALPGYPSWLAGSLPQSITLTVDTSAVRGVDGAGIIQYAPGTAFSRGFTANSTLAASAALTVSRNAASPLPFNVGTGSLGTASEVEVLKFNVKAEYDDVKITDITNLVVAMGGTGGATSGVVYLYDGSDVVSSAAVSGTDADFTDMEIMVAKDTTKTFTVKSDYASASTTLTTSTITVAAASITAENSLGMTVTSLSGTAASYPVYIYTISPTLALASTPTITKTPASEVASSTADAVIKFTMTAQGGDVTIAETGAVTAGYTTTTYAGATSTGVAVTYGVAGAGTPSGGVYTIAKDTTATITVNVNVTAATLPAAYKGVYGYVTMTNLTWNTSQTTNWFVDIFKTDKVILP